MEVGEVVRFISRHRSDLFQVTPTGLVGVQPQRHARQTSQTNSLSCVDRSHNLCVPVCTARSAVTNKRRGGNMVLYVDKLTNKTLYNLSAYANKLKVYCNPYKKKRERIFIFIILATLIFIYEKGSLVYW